MKKPLVAPKTDAERQALIDKYNSETRLDLGVDRISKSATPEERKAIEAGFDIDPRYVNPPHVESEGPVFVSDKTALLIFALFVVSVSGMMCSLS